MAVADTAPSPVTRPSGISLPRYTGSPAPPALADASAISLPRYAGAPSPPAPTPFTPFMPPSDTATRPSGIRLPRYQPGQPAQPRRSVVPVPMPDTSFTSGPLADFARYSGIVGSGASLASRLVGSRGLGQLGSGLGLAANLAALPVIAGGRGSVAQKALGAGAAGLGVLSGASQFEPIRQFMPQPLQDVLALRLRDAFPSLAPAANSFSGISGAASAGSIAPAAAADVLTGGTVPLDAAGAGVGEAAGSIPFVNIAAALLNFGMGVAGGRDPGEAAARAAIAAIPYVGLFAQPIGDAIFGSGLPTRMEATQAEAAKQAAESAHYGSLYDSELAALSTPEQFRDWYASRFTAPGYSGRYALSFADDLPVEQVRPYTLTEPGASDIVPLGSPFVAGGRVRNVVPSAALGSGPTVPPETLLHYLRVNPDLVNVTMPATGDIVSPGPYITGLKNALVAAARRMPSVAAPRVYGAGDDLMTDPSYAAYIQARRAGAEALAQQAREHSASIEAHQWGGYGFG